MREKEKEYDNALREKENKMLFKDNYMQLTDDNKLNNLLENKEILAIAPEEKKPQTTIQIEDYVPNSITKENDNILEEKNNNKDYNNIKIKEENKKNNLIEKNNNILDIK